MIAICVIGTLFAGIVELSVMLTIVSFMEQSNGNK